MRAHILRAAFAAAALIGLAACAADPTATAAIAAEPAISAADPGAQITAVGSFTGDSGHETGGSVSIAQVDGRWVVTLGPDFALDGAPDPKVALGSDGYTPAGLLEPLRSNTGAQSYVLPADFDVADFNQVWIWCEQFSVPLGHADLTLT